MKLIKLFTPKELNLTEEEVETLQENCEGNADNCYAHMYVEDLGMPYYDDEKVWYNINQKLIKAGCEIDDMVFIDCCW